VPYDLDSLEPGRRDRLSDFAVLSNTYEPLVTTDARLSIAPGLATHWENPDEKTWVFHLRPLVRFHDGSPLTPDDVVFSFRRLLDDQQLEARRHILAIEEVARASDSSIRVRIRTPLPDFLNRIRFIHVVRQGSTAEDLRFRPNGTGPFRVLSYQPEKDVTFARNDGYWGPKTPFDRAVLRLNRTGSTVLADFTNGQSDLIQANSRDAITYAGARPGVAVHRVPSITVKLLQLDVASERTPWVAGGRNPFRDRRVREALHLALDRTRLAGMLQAPAIPAYQLVPPVIFGYDPGLPQPVPDLARARTLLAQAGWPKGFEVTLHARTILADGAEAVRLVLAEAGIRVKVRLLPEKEFFEATEAARPDFAMALTRFGCPTGDAAMLFDAGLHTLEPLEGYGRANAGGYASREADELIEEAGRALHPAVRKETLQRLMRLAMSDLPWIPLYVEEEVYLAAPGIAWEPRLDNYVLLSEVSVR
jgi:peptide/nickel transport system substrate-binding protein